MAMTTTLFTALIQLIAATQARREVSYFTFDDSLLRDELYDIHVYLTKTNPMGIGTWNYVSHRKVPCNSHYPFLFCLTVWIILIIKTCPYWWVSHQCVKICMKFNLDCLYYRKYPDVNWTIWKEDNRLQTVQEDNKLVSVHTEGVWWNAWEHR